MENVHPLRTFREKHDPPLTQDKLAELLGVTKPTVSRWESRTRSPRRKQIPRISEVTGITPAQLLGLEQIEEAVA